MIIDKLAYSSRLRGIDVRLKTLFSALLLAACVISQCIPLNIVILALVSVITVIRGGIPLRVYAKLLRIPLIFMLISTLTIAFTAGEASEYYLKISIGTAVFGIGKAGLYTGVLSMIKAISAVGCMYFLALSTPMTQLFSFLYSTPVPDFIVELCQLIYRYVFVLYDAAHAIRTAQESRLGYETLKGKYRSTAQLGAMMFIRAYKQADRTYTALESRGYNGNLRLLCEKSEIKPYQAAAAVIIPAVFIAAAFIVR